MSTMNVDDIKEGLRRLLAVEAGEAAPSRLERIQLRPPEEWDDDDWEFANQRGLVPSGLQGEYQRRVIERRHERELAMLSGEDVAANFGGNIPGLGTATASVQAPMGSGLGTTVAGQQLQSPSDRLRSIELEEERLRGERESLLDQVEADEEAAAAAGDYSNWTNAKLRKEIDSRNDGREVDDMIQPASSRKDDLVEALREDDSRRTTQPPS